MEDERDFETGELNAYEEEVKKVVGIFAPHLGESNVFETRTTQWRIVQ